MHSHGLKGHHISAQGNALGKRKNNKIRPRNHDNQGEHVSRTEWKYFISKQRLRFSPFRPKQRHRSEQNFSQGVALG